MMHNKFQILFFEFTIIMAQQVNQIISNRVSNMFIHEGSSGIYKCSIDGNRSGFKEEQSPPDVKLLSDLTKEDSHVASFCNESQELDTFCTVTIPRVVKGWRNLIKGHTPAVKDGQFINWLK